MKPILIAIFLLLVSLAPEFEAHGQELPKPLRFLGNDKIPPIISAQDGMPVGLVVDLAYAIAEKSQLSIGVEVMDWPTAQSLVLTGKADALLQINTSPEREKLYDFSAPLLESRFHIFRKSTRPDMRDLASLYGKAVGVEAGGFPMQYLGKYDRIRLVMLPGWTAGFAMLKKGEIDAIVVDRWVGEFELSRNNITGVQVAEAPLAMDSSRIAVRKGNRELLDRINLGLAAIERDGTRQRILKKWNAKEVVYLTRDFVDRLVLLVSLVCFALLIVFVLRALARSRPLGKKSSGVLSEVALAALRYGLAILTVVISFGLWEALLVWTGPGLHPFITFYPAIMIIALLAGFGPGLLATASAGFVAFYWILLPPGRIRLDSQVDLAGLTFFLCMGLLISGIAELYRRNRDKAIAYDYGIAVRESEEKYRKLFENMAEEVHFWKLVRDEAGNIKTWRLVDVNPPTLKTWGRPNAEEIRGKTTDEIFGPGATDHYMTIVQKIMTEGVPYTYEDYFPNLDKHFRFTSVPLGEYFITTGADITGIKKINAALEESEEKYRTLVQYAPAGIYEVDFPSGRFTQVNDAMCRILGYTRNEFLTMKAFDVLDDDGKTRFTQRMSKAQTGEKPDEAVEYRVRTKDGRLIWALLNTKFRMKDGKFVGATVVAHDITERKRAEDALRESEGRFKALTETSSLAIGVSLSDGKFLYVNKAYEKLLGFTLKELNHLNASDLWRNPEDRHKMIDAVRSNGFLMDYEVELKRKDGTTLWVMLSVNQVDYGGNQAIMASVYDISRRKQAEEEIQTTSQRFYMILSSMYTGLLLVTDDGRIEFANQAFCDYFELKNSPASLIGIKSPDILEKIKNAYLHPDKALARILEIVELGQPVKGEEVPLRSKRELLRDFIPIRLNGKSYGRLWHHTDITERKLAEETLRTTAEELGASNKELESFSYSVSHDLRSPLRAINGFSKILLEDYSERLDDAGTDLLTRITTSTDRMASIINDMLSLAKISRESINCQEIDLSSIANSVVNELRQTGPERNIEINVAHELPAFADARLMRITLWNLIENAWKYSNKNPSARIDIGVMSKENENVFVIRDNGAGFDMNLAHKLFQPFQRLHSDSQFPGTGVGLAIVNKIIQRHGGRIWAESAIGKGTTFYFTVASPREEG